MSEWFKELVLKTSDSQEPWVRIPPSPPYRHQPKAKLNKRIILFAHLENYSRGRRGAPAKGVGWVTAARVQIPHSPPGKGQSKDCPFRIFTSFKMRDLNPTGTNQALKNNRRILRRHKCPLVCLLFSLPPPRCIRHWRCFGSVTHCAGPPAHVGGHDRPAQSQADL